ncbi:unnamed protein product [Phytophthora fragariaefolia]|uniref:RxLR effector protein n=1 Tax=Phytophthora fragariaefolia TaxID=1490495 RepID=A0A9W7CJV2_9STRA|nr:unnamed protein product [Phytophthora fragariaefolia]
MRAYLALLVAAAVLVSSGDASTSNTAISTFAAAKSLLSETFAEHANVKRSLRSAEKVASYDDEERAWSNIKGFMRTKAETVDEWLQPRLDIRMNVVDFAKKDLGIVSRTAVTQHENWNALVKYLKMYHHAVTGEKWSKQQAADVLLQNIITKANGFK